jgi:mediator of RNA polymerase II transcription subunit 12
VSEIPQPTKPLSFDPFRHYPKTSTSEVPTDLPLEYRKQILSLLSSLSTGSAVTNLVTYRLDVASNLLQEQPVINQPWEWIENLDETSAVDGPSKDEDFDRQEKARLKTRYLVKNSGSLSLEHFSAQITGDGVVELLAKEYDAQALNDIRTFEDGLDAEGIFARDWRESRTDFDESISSPASVSSGRAIQSAGGGAGSGDGDQESGSSSSHVKTERKLTPMRASPASSIVSRGSAKGSTSSLKQQSPTVRLVSEGSDPDGPSRGVAKRKMDGGDDEAEVIEGPAPIHTAPPTKRARAGAGKTTGKTSGKSRAKKR